MTVPLKQRSNDEWLAELPDGEAAKELRSYLQGGLRKVLAGQSDVDDADIDDFTQDAIIQILKKMDTFRGDSRFTTWAMAVAIRCAYGALRTRRHRNSRLEEIGERSEHVGIGRQVHAAAPDQLAQRGDLVETLYNAIRNELTDRQRTAVLDELSGVPSGRIAEKLDVNRNALYKIHHDARKKLRKALNDAGFSDEDVRKELAETSKG